MLFFTLDENKKVRRIEDFSDSDYDNFKKNVIQGISLVGEDFFVLQNLLIWVKTNFIPPHEDYSPSEEEESTYPFFLSRVQFSPDDNPLEERIERHEYNTWEDALKGHKSLCEGLISQGAVLETVLDSVPFTYVESRLNP